MRRCYMCQKEKPLEEFTRDNDRSSGRGYRCKACDGTLSRDRYWKEKFDPPLRVIASLIARQQIKLQVLEEKIERERRKLEALREQHAIKAMKSTIQEAIHR